uniref:SCP domain-containing protein n=1 Tax=Parastrongyloides trichosuri TaxID=131310 RepID=A0A0N5A0M3_PARTI
MGNLQTKGFAKCIVYSWYKQKKSYNFNDPKLNLENRNFAGIVYKNADKFGCGQFNRTDGIFLGCKIHMKGNFDNEFKENIQNTDVVFEKTSYDPNCSRI